ncbi:MAG: DMT family transporter [Ferruginibacter sp.]|nr:DMT family transporter [Ferruginibacter sp.]
MNKNFLNWLLFIALSLIWGSSFILIKIGLDNHLNPYQVAALRIVSAGLVLLPSMIKYIRRIPSNKLFIVFMSGALGSLLPSFLFCMAEEGIDSSLAGTLNCLTPVFVILTGAILYQTKTSANKITGIIIAFTGSFLLLISKGRIQESQHLVYVSFVVLATILYGINVNMVAKHLLHISSLHIAAVALSLNAIPALLVLIFTGYFSLPLANHNLLVATAAACALGIVGTAMATILFYMLVKRAGGIFATTVTYGIPFIAIGWGIFYGEVFGWKQVVCLLIILFGVYWVNKKVVVKHIT